MSLSKDQLLNIHLYYSILVEMNSAREVARRNGFSHPTVLSRAGRGSETLAALPDVQSNGALRTFFSWPFTKQGNFVTEEIRELIKRLAEPYVLDYQSRYTEAKAEPKVSISARIPESAFRKFKLICERETSLRSSEVTISSLLAEIVEAYVNGSGGSSSGAQVTRSDLLLREIKDLIVRHEAGEKTGDTGV